MAENVAFPYNLKLQVNGYASSEQFFSVKTFHLPSRRSLSHGRCKVNRFSQWKTSKLVNPHLNIPNISLKQDTPIRCCCLSALTSVDGAIASDWTPFVDQVLLLASITLTYMAGVIESEKPQYNAPTSTPLDVLPENSSSGSARTDDEVGLQFTWNVVKGKLMDSLSAIKEGENLSEKVVGSGQNSAKLPSSLCAVAEGPRIRLLWSSFQWLSKGVSNISTNSSAKSTDDFLGIFDEIIQNCCRPLCRRVRRYICHLKERLVANISANSSAKSTDDFLGIFDEIIQNCCRPLCIAWLEEELCLIAGKPDKELFSLIERKLLGYDSILQNIRKSGKENLYAELVYALKFGSPRKGGCYNSSFYIQHGVVLLEDLLITLADGIASMYLELISVDSSLSNEISNLGLSLCTLSTRALQRLRNEVALHQWLHQNMAAVISMYEDQFDLCTLKRQLIEDSDTSDADNFGWWKRLIVKKSRSQLRSLHFVEISHISVPVKRTKELRALTGWRYYFSLFLELSDITMPFVRTIISKVSDAISFFLVCLIGRSLGLIYSGIRNSLRLK